MPGEAMLSFYFGRDASFVWAVPKHGPVAFAAIDATAGETRKQGADKLREALEPQAATDLRHSRRSISRSATSSIRCC